MSESQQSPKAGARGDRYTRQARGLVNVFEAAHTPRYVISQAGQAKHAFLQLRMRYVGQAHQRTVRDVTFVLSLHHQSVKMLIGLCGGKITRRDFFGCADSAQVSARASLR